MASLKLILVRIETDKPNDWDESILNNDLGDTVELAELVDKFYASEISLQEFASDLFDYNQITLLDCNDLYCRAEFDNDESQAMYYFKMKLV